MLGAVFALLSALSFSLQNVMARRGMVQASATAGAAITVLMGVPIFILGALVTGQLLKVGALSLEDIGLLAGAGVVHFVAGRSFNYRAIEAIGAARAGPVQALTTPYTVLVAVLFLGEHVSPGMALGIILILIGPVVMVERRARRPVVPDHEQVASRPDPSPQSDLRQTQGYGFAVLAALAYGSSPILIRAALEDQSGLSVLGGLVAYVAAALLLLLTFGLPGNDQLISSLRPETVRAFLGAGFFVAMAQMLRFVALSLAPVAVVASLTRTGVVSTLALSWMLNRHLEFITPRVVAGVLVSVLGAVLLVLASN